MTELKCRELTVEEHVHDSPQPRPKRQRAWGQLIFVVLGLASYETAHLLSSGRRRAALAHAHEVLRAEHVLGIAFEHAVQGFVLQSEGLRALANDIYTWVYWPIVVGALIFLWHYDRRRYRVLRDGMLLSGAIGLVVFILYPVAPPRMLRGFTNTISRSSIEHLVVHGSFADPFAALPSFHAGWVALAVVVVAYSLRRVLAMFWAGITAAAMTLAVIVTANHYVIDAVSGILLAIASGVVVALVRRAMSAGATSAGAMSAGAATPGAPRGE